MGGNRRATSIHRHLASVGAAITGVIGGLFLMVLFGVSLDTSREQMIERNEALGRHAVVLHSAPTERWPSGRRRTPGKCVYGNVSRVRIPPSPPTIQFWSLKFAH